MLHRQFVHESLVANQLLKHVRRRRRASAVIQIDHRAIQIECPLNLAPVCLIFSELLRGPIAGNRIRFEQLPECILAHHRQCNAGASQTAHERSTGCHRNVLDLGNNH